MGINTNNSPDTQSLVFGFVFFTIFVTFLSGAFAWQRWTARRTRLGGVAPVVGNLEEKRPAIWDVRVCGGKDASHWEDMTPLAARLAPVVQSPVLPPSPPPLSSPPPPPPRRPNRASSSFGDTFAQHPSFFPRMTMPNHIPEKDVKTNREKSADLTQHSRPLQVSVVISMPVPPSLRSPSGLSSPSDASPAYEDQPQYEIGVAEVRLRHV